MSTALKIDGPELIKGLAVPFGEAAVIGETIDGQRKIYREVFSPNSFADIPARIAFVRRHDRNSPIGWAKLRVTGRGLELEAEPLDTGSARDALAEVKSGLLRGISIGFMQDPDRDIWTREAGELPMVKRRGAELIECSLVARGAYASAVVTEVSRLSWQTQDSERFMAPYRKQRERELVEARAESAQLLADTLALGRTAPLNTAGVPVPLNATLPTDNAGVGPSMCTVVDLGGSQVTVMAADVYEAERLAHGYLDATVQALRAKGSSLTRDEMSELQAQHRVLV